jgi:hypothetical protein
MLDEKHPNEPFKRKKRQCGVMMKEVLPEKDYPSSKSGAKLRKKIFVGDAHGW